MKVRFYLVSVSQETDGFLPSTKPDFGGLKGGIFYLSSQEWRRPSSVWGLDSSHLSSDDTIQHHIDYIVDRLSLIEDEIGSF